MTNYGEGHYGPIRNWKRGFLVSHGGMGEMFIGKNADNGQLFLVKSVASEPVWSRQLAALQNEERILRKLSKLRCPNIFRTVGNATSESVAEMGGKPTMDLFLEFSLPGGNITEIVKRTGKLKESVAKAYTFQVLQALACMHRNGIVHRDIRGVNIIVRDRVAKLIGFGHAKDVSTCLTKQCSWSGREKQPQVDSHHPPRPEKSTEKQALTCSHSEIQEDISALGMVVYEMVTGRRPKFKLESSLPIDKAILSLKEDFVRNNMLNCLSFIQSCFIGDDVVEGKALGTGHWTAERLLTHPWIVSMGPFSSSDLPSCDEAATGSLTSRANPTLFLKTDAITQTATSPRLPSLKICAGKLCCRTMDTDNVIPPLSSRSMNSEHRARKGGRISRILTL